MRGLIVKKIGMTRVFDSNGFAVPVTVLEAGPCQVTQVKSIEKDGYDSVQVGFNEVSLKHLNKPMKGHFDKQSVTPMRVLAEFNKVPNFDYKPGQVFNVGLFKEGDYVTVSGKSKGRGFSGTIKRYSFSQHVGSIGAASDPSRVFPGKKMPGRHGNKKVSVKSLEVIKVDEGNNQLLLKGGIPGARNGIVIITR